jgi:SAM-dependent methyltransferase
MTSFRRIKEKLKKRLGKSPPTTLRSFKSEAWQNPASANLYHTATQGGPQVFQLVRQDLYIDRVRRFAEPGARILDLGCGSGLASFALADLGYEMVSCDVSRDMLNVLDREKGDRKIETRQGDAYAVPAADGEFDVVISRMFIQHFSDWPKILAEKGRVVKPGGYVIFDFGSREHFEASGLAARNDCGFPYGNDPTRSDSFYAVASEEEMRAAASAVDLRTVEISPIGLLLYNGFIWKEFGPEGVAGLNATLDRLLKVDEARELMVLIEKRVMPLLPKAVSYCNMTVLQK